MLVKTHISWPLAVCLPLALSLTTAQHQTPVDPGSVSDASRTPLEHHPSNSAQQHLHQQSEVKILVCGDSISQGSENDFTWRYRLWEWFQQSSTTTTTPALKFVGPYNGTFPSIKPPASDPPVPATTGPYHPSVSPAFLTNSAHFAVYGRPAWQDVDLIAAQVTAHTPDVVILHLGFNDIGWWGTPPALLIQHVQQLVWNARSARRNVTVLVADVSHRLLVSGREEIPVATEEYNALLGRKVSEWTHEDSPVVLVRVSEEYDCEYK